MVADPPRLNPLHAALPGIEINTLIHMSWRRRGAIKKIRKTAVRKRPVIAVLVLRIIRLLQHALVPQTCLLPALLVRRPGRRVRIAVVAARAEVECALALRTGASWSDGLWQCAASGDQLAWRGAEVVDERENAECEAGKEELRACVCDGTDLAVVELPPEIGGWCEEVRD